MGAKNKVLQLIIAKSAANLILYKLLDLTTAGHSFFYMKTSQKNHFPLELEDFFLLLWSFLLYNRLNMRFFGVGRNGDDQGERERDLELEMMTEPGVEIKRVAKK